MAGEIQLYIDILSDKAGALSAISSLQTLDATVKKNDASIKALEKTYADASSAARKAAGAGNMVEAAKYTKEAERAAAGLNATREKQALAMAKQDIYRQGLDKQVSAMGQLMEKAKETGGPLGDLAGKLENFTKGGMVGVAIAIVAALGAMAVALGYAALKATAYAFSMADAARTSRAFSEAALGSAKAGDELEAVVDQMSNLAPGLNAKLKDVGRSLGDVGIRGRDAQRALNTFGIVATARGEQAAGAIKSIAESSRLAGRLTLGPLNRITGEFDSLRGTGIKSADVFKALATVTGKSADAFKNARTAGLVPFKDGLKAIELAAQTSLGGVVAKQMMSLSSQIDKVKENVGRLFSGVNIEKFLAGLKTVTDLFDQNTVTGYILREVFTAAFTKIASLAALAFPYIVAGIKGAVFAAITFATVAKQAYKAISDFVSGGKNIDGISLAFKLGAMAIGAMVGAVVGLAASFAFLGAIAIIALAPIWIPIALTALAFYGIITAIDAVVDEAKSLGKEIASIDLAKSAGKMIDGLVNGIKSKIGDIKGAILEVSGAITSAFDSDQEIRSPGRKAMRKGKHVVEGHALGMVQNVPMVEAATMKVSGAVTRGLESDTGGQGQTGGNNAPTFAFTNCQFGSVDQATIEEMMAMAFAKMQRGLAGAT